MPIKGPVLPITWLRWVEWVWRAFGMVGGGLRGIIEASNVYGMVERRKW